MLSSDEEKRKEAEDAAEALFTIGAVLSACALIIFGSIKGIIWIVDKNPAYLTIPIAIIGFAGLFTYDWFKKKADDQKLRDALHDENDDWRDPYW